MAKRNNFLKPEECPLYGHSCPFAADITTIKNDIQWIKRLFVIYVIPMLAILAALLKWISVPCSSAPLPRVLSYSFIPSASLRPSPMIPQSQKKTAKGTRYFVGTNSGMVAPAVPKAKRNTEKATRKAWVWSESAKPVHRIKVGRRLLKNLFAWRLCLWTLSLISHSLAVVLNTAWCLFNAWVVRGHVYLQDWNRGNA